MQRTPESIQQALTHLTEQAQRLIDTLSAELEQNETLENRRAPETRQAFVERLLAALQTSLAEQSGSALLQVMDEHAAHEQRAMLELVREILFVALLPVLAAGQAYGAPTLGLIAEVFTDAAVLDTQRRLNETRARFTEQARELRIFKNLVDNALDGIGVASLDGVMQYANRAYREMSGFGDQAVGSTILEYFHAESAEDFARDMLPALIQEDRWQGLMHLQRPDGTAWTSQTSAFLLTDSAGNPSGISAIFRDVTAELDAEQERLALQEQVIVAQQAVLRELSTPLIPLSESVLVMPLIGSIDSSRAQQVLEALLEGVAQAQVRTAILDITGVRVVDTQVAGALIRAAQAVRLLGAQTIITGIRPEIAQTLVGLGLDMSGMTTCATLQRGVALALGTETL